MVARGRALDRSVTAHTVLAGGAPRFARRFLGSRGPYLSSRRLCATEQSPRYAAAAVLFLWPSIVAVVAQHSLPSGLASTAASFFSVARPGRFPDFARHRLQALLSRQFFRSIADINNTLLHRPCGHASGDVHSRGRPRHGDAGLLTRLPRRRAGDHPRRRSALVSFNRPVPSPDFGRESRGHG